MPFAWGDSQQEAFDQLKRKLCEAPLLHVPDFSREFVLTTDASNTAVSAVLQQRMEGGLVPISYHRRILNPAEKKYSAYEKECLVVLFGLEKCRL